MHLRSKKEKKSHRKKLRLKMKRKKAKSRKALRKIIKMSLKSHKAKKLISSSDKNSQAIRTNKKRILIFLGAGATNCFNGPAGEYILNEFKANNKYRTKSNIPVGQFLFDKLFETYGDQTNFETIIASIELLLNYHLSQQNNSSDPIFKSIIPIFFTLDESFLDQIDNFVIHDTQDESEMVILEYYVDGNIETMSLARTSVRIYYYSRILSNFLSLLAMLISQYEDGVEDYNSKFKRFVNYLIRRNYTINFFTTNYDNLIPTILIDKKIFNGFDIKGHDGNNLLFNPHKIVFDDTSIKYFNLHGSIYWHYEFLMEYSEYRYVFNNEEYDLPFLPLTDLSNPGEEIVLSNIITGYNKTQRTLIPPFSLMLESFIKECTRADILLIIGYSFSDSHLNKILSLPFSFNSPKIINITKSTDNYLNTPEGHRFRKTLKKHDRLSNTVNPQHILSSQDKKQTVFINGLDDFLDNSDNWKSFLT
jgi:hypothetical protein